MTPAEICVLSQASLENIQSLKKEFDVLFEALTVSASRKDWHKLRVLQADIENKLKTQPVARNFDQISNTTRVYIGRLEAGMFKNFPKSIEHVYTSFPNKEVTFEGLQIGGKTGQELSELMKEAKIDTTTNIHSIMDRSEFKTALPTEQIDLIKLRVSDLALPKSPTTEQIYTRIAELGLELCPPETGPHYRLTHLDLPSSEWVHIGSEPFIMSNKSANIMRVGGVPKILRTLGCTSAGRFDSWKPDDLFMFRIRKAA